MKFAGLRIMGICCLLVWRVVSGYARFWRLVEFAGLAAWWFGSVCLAEDCLGYWQTKVDLLELGSEFGFLHVGPQAAV